MTTPTPTPTCSMAAVTPTGVVDHNGEGLTPKEVNFINFQRQNYPYSSTYNTGWRNHPNLSWGNQNAGLRPFQNLQAPQNTQPQKKEESLEDIVRQLTKVQVKMGEKIDGQDESIKRIEKQIGQIAAQLSSRSQGTFPTDTEKNPKAPVFAMSTEGYEDTEACLPRILYQSL